MPQTPQSVSPLAKSPYLNLPGCTCREYLLAVLLRLTLELLRGDPPEDRETTLGGNLATNLLKVCRSVFSLVVFAL